jgi:hypothetical protein
MYQKWGSRERRNQKVFNLTVERLEVAKMVATVGKIFFFNLTVDTVDSLP